VFVGHGLVAFAIVAWAAVKVGWPRERALALGVVASAFGLLPDVDMVYAPVGLLTADGGALVEGFWAASALVHRTMTHSLAVALVAAVGFAAWRRGDAPGRGAALALLAGLVAVGALTNGVLGGAVMVVFTGVGLLATRYAGRLDVRPGVLFAVALVGLASHPFGDLLTGRPPAFLYPFDATLVGARVALHADPTLHLLGSMAFELAALWAGAITYVRLTGRTVRAQLRTPAALGVGYAGAVVVVPQPTLGLSYPFVFSVLAVGVGCAVLAVGVRRVRGRPSPAPRLSTALTSLAAVTVATAAYAAAYLLVG
jgi:membrane-bound metal-dependent hydrolase YbcI (DUF457 family)